MNDMSAKILVIGPSWVGDMVMAQSLFRLLKQANEEVRIDVVAPAWSEPLIARMPEVRRSIEMPLGHGKFKPLERLRLGRQLASEKYAQAIVLPYTWKSALLPYGAKIAKRTGFKGEARWGLLNDIRLLDKKKLPMMVERYVSLGFKKNAFNHQDFPKPKLVTSEKLQQAVLSKLDLQESAKDVVAFCPGAEYGPAKQWPTTHYAKLAIKLIESGKTIWLLGSAKDSTIAQEINRLTSHKCNDLTGRTSLEDVIDLLALVSLVVCNDSGLMHIAAAVDTPVVALYGSSDPGYTPPLSDKTKIVSLELECSPCFKKECPLGHYDCLQGLSVEQVWKDINLS